MNQHAKESGNKEGLAHTSLQPSRLLPQDSGIAAPSARSCKRVDLRRNRTREAVQSPVAHDRPSRILPTDCQRTVRDRVAPDATRRHCPSHPHEQNDARDYAPPHRATGTASFFSQVVVDSSLARPAFQRSHEARLAPCARNRITHTRSRPSTPDSCSPSAQVQACGGRYKPGRLS